MIMVDNFAGGGGVSCGMQMALGRGPDYAVNHDQEAILMHTANHPNSRHLREDVFAVDHRAQCAGKPVSLMWFSPDCKHFSKAKGAKPVSKKIRGLAWSAVRAAEQVRPAVICLENVEEFLTWGPLGEDGRPCKMRAGETFHRFCDRLKRLGYELEYRCLNAADYGAPTARIRFFLIARCDGRPIVWPAPTHGKGLIPYKTVADYIDWSVEGRSIFGRKTPLKDATMRRIAKGLVRYVIEAKHPFIAPIKPTDSTDNSELVSAFIAKHYSGVTGHDMRRPIGTITTWDHHALVSVWMTKFYGTSIGSSIEAPAPTITAGGQHLGVVTAFLDKYYATGVAARIDKPLDTITCKARFGLVMVEGTQYQITDIKMRMLTPRELALLQGFPPDYILTGTQASQIARIGNSVPPPLAAAIIGANCPQEAREVAG
jgi:DNA (cytosine-5)-methyltransferase 1